ncbi:hypothetical protein [Paenibacillus sp. OSY-SE]|uniref:hypothetical protein n=1 Tax=Paenibacillus sp. OSY-SE TaxID=1196323 RepID=UPI0002D9D748|nr:hypothetical protein [Paenibacillus sp. OSY-SE]
MGRFEDEPGYKYAFSSVLYRREQVAVKCARCGGLAYIFKGEHANEVKCTTCFYHEKEPESYRYSASGVCEACEKWFNEDMTDKKQLTQKVIHIRCPHCSAMNQVPLRRTLKYAGCYSDIRHERDPVFNLELYYLDYFRGKPVWAVNRAHLNYLIAYISADLREKPGNGMKRTASHTLPRYMKEAKNREAMVKTLRRLQLKDE